MERWVENIKKLLEQKKSREGWKGQITLAEKIGVTRAQIGHYLNSRRQPPLDKLQKMADAFGVNLNALLSISENDEVEFAREYMLTKSIALLAYENLDDYIKLRDLSTITHRKIVINMRTHEEEKILDNAIAVIVKGNAMVSKETHPHTLYPGDIATIAIDKAPEAGDVVLAKTPEGFIFRLYDIDGDKISLFALNKEYGKISFTPTTSIVGVLIDSSRHHIR
jgi:transcriptional regulator with XRE-family HTH domain